MSSATYGPPITLAGPLPQPLPFGLFSVATVVPETDPPRWGMGATIRPYMGVGDDGYPAYIFDPCSTGTARPKTFKDQPDTPFFQAFGVYLADRCAARGIGTDDALNNRARAAFAAVEQWAVEHEFASGEQMPSNPYLADGNADVLLGGAATAPVEGLAQLEAVIGDTGRAGVIHADRATVAGWSGFGLLRVVGNRLETYNGTPVASGGGYHLVGQDGEAEPDGEQGWAWATGPVEIRRSSEIEIIPGSLAEALDRENNEISYLAERDYLVDWDTQLQAAILVDRSL